MKVWRREGKRAGATGGDATRLHVGVQLADDVVAASGEHQHRLLSVDDADADGGVEGELDVVQRHAGHLQTRARPSETQ